ncbi:MFS transporter [Beijerinckia sp. L45]|uniref:MFS transporter n=1 Tax=Beijerinckia sp. L45 TaxID=1641855 RepID=UPI00131E8439|nr:MFS transporter [Beijerinckia sp. L45]
MADELGLDLAIDADPYANGARPPLPASIASKRVKRHQRTALLFLIVSNGLNYVDRATVSIASPLIRRDLGLSLTQIGLVMSIFLITYSLMLLPIGALVDRLKPRLMLAVGLVVWSGAQAVGGICNSFGQMAVTRVLLGIGESPQFPSSLRVLRDWYNGRDRGFATGLFATGSTLGVAIAAPLLTWLMLTFSWRWMFVIMAAFGVLLAIGWYVCYQDPRSVDLTAEERAYLDDGDREGAEERNVTFAEWAGLLRFRSTWGIMLGVGTYTYLLTIYNSWLPVYLEMDRHMSIGNTGFTAAIPFIFGVFGSVLGGASVDLLTKRGFTPLESSRLVCVAGVLAATMFTVAAAEATTTVGAVAAMSGAVCSLYVNVAASWTLAAAVAPKSYVGSLAGMKTFGGYVGGALAPIATGYLAHATGSFEVALLVGASTGILSALSLLVAVRRPISAEALDKRSDLSIVGTGA